MPRVKWRKGLAAIIMMIILTEIGIALMNNPRVQYSSTKSNNNLALPSSTEFPSAQSEITNSSEGRFCTQSQRVDFLRNYCDHHKYEYSNILPNFYVSQKHKMLFCHITKSAGTLMKAVLALAEGNLNKTLNKFRVHSRRTMNEAGLLRFKSFTELEKEEMLQTYYKFVVVRHPLTRLVSAWKDKFLPNQSAYRFRMGREIMKRYRDPSNNTLGRQAFYSKRPYFHEFIRFIMDTGKKDNHWKPYVDFCHPCSVNWDGILRVENLDNEAHFFMDRFETPFNGNELPKVHTHSASSGELYKIQKVHGEYSDVPEEYMKKLMAVYGDDIGMFGYQWNSSIHLADCAIPVEGGQRCC